MREKKLSSKTQKLSNYQPNDRVILQDMDKKGRWIKRGKIIRETRGKNSFIVQLDDGTEYERHCHHIRDDKAHKDYNEVQIVPQIPEENNLEDNAQWFRRGGG